VRSTAADSAKFDRFATKVLGDDSDPGARDELRARMDRWIAIRTGYNRRNFPGYDHGATVPPGPLAFGHFGQLDAVGAIVNEVYWNASKEQDLEDPTAVSRPADAPVSYPFLWNAHQQDKVQWLGIAESGGPGNILSLVRNVGEVIGVFGVVEIPESVGILNKGYPSTVDRAGLVRLEELIATLWSPEWPESFGALDPALVERGSELFRRPLEQGKSCFGCHGEIDRTDPDRRFEMTLYAVGTDPRAFNNFQGRSGPSGKLEGRPVRFIPLTTPIAAESPASPMLTHEILGAILGTYTQDPPIDQLKDARYGRRSDVLERAAVVRAEYEARPLNGIWATAPYLHNGSVPTLDALLRRASERPASFTVGTRLFDPVKVGLGELPPTSTLPKYGTDQPGHSNVGHEYGVDLEEDERKALIEYLKSL
jgi:hypothetical protein